MLMYVFLLIITQSRNKKQMLKNDYVQSILLHNDLLQLNEYTSVCIGKEG